MKVCLNKEIAPGIFEMDLEIPEEIDFRCGQFVNLSVGDGAHLLRRPFAILAYDKELRTVCVCYQVKGEGTRLLAAKKEGDALTCVLPLGNGFTIREDQKRVALIGGGVGVFPLLSPSCANIVKATNIFALIWDFAARSSSETFHGVRHPFGRGVPRDGRRQRGKQRHFRRGVF